jgi:S1-C subfamily serine protease
MEAAANVVRVRVPLGGGANDIGTGVYLGDRYVATCYHTFRGNPKVGDVTFQDGTVISFKINAGLEETDQAIIQLDYPHDSLLGVTISDDLPEKGDAVYSVGMGNSIDNRVRIFGGPVASFFGVGGRPVRSIFLTHAKAATPGDSGGPTFSEDGQLYGCLKGYVNGEDVTLSSRPPIFREFVSPLLEPIRKWRVSRQGDR